MQGLHKSWKVLEIEDAGKKSWKVMEIGEKVLESPGNSTLIMSQNDTFHWKLDKNFRNLYKASLHE